MGALMCVDWIRVFDCTHTGLIITTSKLSEAAKGAVEYFNRQHRYAMQPRAVDFWEGAQVRENLVEACRRGGPFNFLKQVLTELYKHGYVEPTEAGWLPRLG